MPSLALRQQLRFTTARTSRCAILLRSKPGPTIPGLAFAATRLTHIRALAGTSATEFSQMHLTCICAVKRVQQVLLHPWRQTLGVFVYFRLAFASLR